MKIGKSTRYKRLVCRVALEYALKDLPCSTEWTDMRYKCIRDLVWTSMEPLHGYAVCLYKCVRNSSSKSDIKACLFSIWLQNTKPSIIK